MQSPDTISCKGTSAFRTIIILATLSGQTTKITDIRSDEENDEIGLRDYEVEFLKLIESVTNGSFIEINDTGTTILYKPGIIYGGEVQFRCPMSRTIGYYLEMMLALAPFAKFPFQLTLFGITNGFEDPSVKIVYSFLLYCILFYCVGGYYTISGTFFITIFWYQ